MQILSTEDVIFGMKISSELFIFVNSANHLLSKSAKYQNIQLFHIIVYISAKKV